MHNHRKVCYDYSIIAGTHESISEDHKNHPSRKNIFSKNKKLLMHTTPLLLSFWFDLVFYNNLITYQGQSIGWINVFCIFMHHNKHSGSHDHLISSIPTCFLFSADFSWKRVHNYQHTEVSNDKNPPKIKLKNSWNWLVIHMAATYWHLLKIKHLQWPETEIKWICWNRFWKNSWNHIRWNLFLAGFSHLKPMCSGALAWQAAQ